MKIRTGFVSNSSSSSFVLHTKFTPAKLMEILVNADIPHPKIEENALGLGSFSGWVSMWNSIEDMGEELVAITKFLEKEHGEKSWMITTD